MPAPVGTPEAKLAASALWMKLKFVGPAWPVEHVAGSEMHCPVELVAALQSAVLRKQYAPFPLGSPGGVEEEVKSELSLGHIHMLRMYPPA